MLGAAYDTVGEREGSLPQLLQRLEECIGSGRRGGERGVVGSVQGLQFSWRKASELIFLSEDGCCQCLHVLEAVFVLEVQLVDDEVGAVARKETDAEVASGDCGVELHGGVVCVLYVKSAADGDVAVAVVGGVELQLPGSIVVVATLVEFQGADGDGLSGIECERVGVADGAVLPLIMIIGGEVSVDDEGCASVVALAHGLLVAEGGELPCGGVGYGACGFDGRPHGLAVVAGDGEVYAPVQPVDVDGVHPGHLALSGSAVAVGAVACAHVASRFEVKCVLEEFCASVAEVIA